MLEVILKAQKFRWEKILHSRLKKTLLNFNHVGFLCQCCVYYCCSIFAISYFYNAKSFYLRLERLEVCDLGKQNQH